MPESRGVFGRQGSREGMVETGGDVAVMRLSGLSVKKNETKVIRGARARGKNLVWMSEMGSVEKSS